MGTEDIPAVGLNRSTRKILDLDRGR